MTSAARHAHSVEATLNYLAPMVERPAYYLYEPPPGTPWRNTKGDRHQLAIRDARHLAPAPSLDVEGFALVPFTTAVDDFSDAQAVRTRYYRDVERLVAHVTGAARVVAFDHNLRSATVAGRQADGLQGPVRYAHNDYTERSAPQRVRDLLGADAAALLRARFAVINVWTPLRRPVEGAPLAVCDARTIAPGDLGCGSARRIAGSTSRACGPTRRCSSSASTPTAAAPASPRTPPSTIRPRRPTRRRAKASRCARSRSSPLNAAAGDRGESKRHFVAASRVRRRGGWLRARIARAGCRAWIRPFVLRVRDCRSGSLFMRAPPTTTPPHSRHAKKTSSPLHRRRARHGGPGRALGGARIKSEPLRRAVSSYGRSNACPATRASDPRAEPSARPGPPRDGPPR